MDIVPGTRRRAGKILALGAEAGLQTLCRRLHISVSHHNITENTRELGDLDLTGPADHAPACA